ncbi:MAG: hypothetical protein ABDH49_05130 [Candidatus Hydrothermales bacterium]
MPSSFETGNLGIFADEIYLYIFEHEGFKSVILWEKAPQDLKRYKALSFRFEKKFNYKILFLLLVILIISGIFYTGFKVGRRVNRETFKDRIDPLLLLESLHKMKGTLTNLSNFILEKGDEK